MKALERVEIQISYEENYSLKMRIFVEFSITRFLFFSTKIDDKSAPNCIRTGALLMTGCIVYKEWARTGNIWA